MNKLNVLYEDNHIIVVEKPFNVLSQGDATGDLDLLNMVKQYVKVKYNKPGNVYIGLVHRLDRPVGGIMVFARSSKAASRLNKQFNEHSITKRYLAIVHGKISDSGKFVDKLEKLDNGNTIISDNGKLSELEYKLVQYNSQLDMSLVEVDLKTGRHHQIRVQFASRGYPLVGDQRYGKRDNEQLCLYSYNLSFVHPTTKEVMDFKLYPNVGYFNKFDLK